MLRGPFGPSSRDRHELSGPVRACRGHRTRGPILSTFTTDVAGSLPGPNWLRERRLAALERFRMLEPPTDADEVWRYSPIDELELDLYRVASLEPAAPPPEELAGVEGWFADGESPAAVVVVVDDHVADLRVSPQAAAAGLTVRVLAEDGAMEPGAGFDGSSGYFGLLNDAFAPAPILVESPRSAEIPGAVHVVRVTTVAGAASFPRLLVDVGANSRLDVVEHHRSTDVDALVVPRTELVVGADARARYLAANDLGRGVWQLGALGASVGRNGHLLSAAAGFGGAYARLRTDCRLVGRGATGDLLAVYFADGDQTLDFRTFQDHRAPDTTSDLLFKGAVDDRSRSVYTGLIRVRPEGRNTNAFQTNRNIKLSEDAWAESVPNLEIETNDVRCSHASTVGPIDEEQRFYLESRGVPPEEAERLVLTGFFEEVVARVGIPGVADRLRERIHRKVTAHAERGVAA